jgi:ribonuclease PH
MCRGVWWYDLPAGSRRQRGKMDRRSTELSKVIRNTLEQTVCLELLPRSQIDVYVQVCVLSRASTVSSSRWLSVQVQLRVRGTR